MSSSIRRVFINSYLAYKDDVGESLDNFVAEFNERIIDPVDVNVGQVSLNFTPIHPNIPPNEADIDLSYNGTRQTLTITPTKIYDSVGSSTNSLIDELNTIFKAGFTTTYEPWSYEADDARTVFTPDTGDDAEFFQATTTASRRLGMSSSQFGVNYTTGSPLTMTNQPILSRTQVIYLSTDMTSDAITNAGKAKHGILLTIPIYDPAYGALINYSPDPMTGKLSNPRSFNNLAFRILDDLFEPITFTGNTNLLISLYVSYADDDKGYAGELRKPGFGF